MSADIKVARKKFEVKAGAARIWTMAAASQIIPTATGFIWPRIVRNSPASASPKQPAAA